LAELTSSRRKLKIALFGELSLEEAIDLSGDRQILDYLIDFFHPEDGGDMFLRNVG
jgi:hypothetical protein